MQQIQNLIKMPYGAVGTEVSTEFESDTRITDAEITKGVVVKLDHYTLGISTPVEVKDYVADLVIRTTRGLQFYKVQVRQ